MSNVLEVEDFGQLQDLIDTSDTLVLKFWATWCGPCRQFAPHFDAAAELLTPEGVDFAAVDVDVVPDVVVEYGVRGVPAVKLFRNGQFVADLARTTETRRALAFVNEINNN